LLSTKSCNNWSCSGWFTKFQLSLVLVIRTWPTIAPFVQMYPQVEFFSCWWLQREYNPPLGRDTWLIHSSQIKNLILHLGDEVIRKCTCGGLVQFLMLAPHWFELAIKRPLLFGWWATWFIPF
jgi:hypothetical protein